MNETTLQQNFCNALLTGDRHKCNQIANTYLDNGQSLNELYEEVIQKSLYEIGEMWEAGKISVATEHMASAVVEALLNALYFRVISEQKLQKTVLTGCVEKEHHQIGIKMVSDVFEQNGWNAHFLGANTPTGELIKFIHNTKPDILALSLSLYFHFPMLEMMINSIRKEFPKLPILTGGQAFRHGGIDLLEKYTNVMYLPNLKEIDQFVKNLNQNG